jgi:putative tryptophan/tyrosine transport system substrate-binding protein
VLLQDDAIVFGGILRPTVGMMHATSLLTPKRQELLHELVPTATLVAMLVNPKSPQTQSELRSVQAAADSLGQPVRIFSVGSDREIDAAFATIIDQRIRGLLVQPDQFFTGRRDQLVLVTTRHAIPTIFGWREFVIAGGLISYGTSLRVAYRQVAIYTGRILKGEKPADLPVQQATGFEMVVNLKAAKAIGVTIPTAILLRAESNVTIEYRWAGEIEATQIGCRRSDRLMAVKLSSGNFGLLQQYLPNC